MNARDIIKLAAQLYVYEESKKNITVLTNIQKGKDINGLRLAMGRKHEYKNRGYSGRNKKRSHYAKD